MPAAATAEDAARRALRQHLLAQRERFADSPQAAAAGTTLASALRSVVADLSPDCLGLYWPVRSEFNAAAAIAADSRQGIFALALPYARRQPPALDFRRWRGDEPDLVDECGIGSSGGEVVVPDVVLVPCVGFTAAGLRLGYGGGFYDRWLAAHPHVTSIGVAWSFAEVDAATFAARGHDVALTLVVTERGVV
ncbi:MAG: 5-formyltetrahydrofolate cyclo-ligase [Caldimonas sp.]